MLKNVKLLVSVVNSYTTYMGHNVADLTFGIG